MNLIDNTINEQTEEYEDISEVANGLRRQIPVPMLFSIFAGKLNAFEIIILLIIFVLVYLIMT